MQVDWTKWSAAFRDEGLAFWNEDVANLSVGGIDLSAARDTAANKYAMFSGRSTRRTMEVVHKGEKFKFSLMIEKGGSANKYTVKWKLMGGALPNIRQVLLIFSTMKSGHKRVDSISDITKQGNDNGYQCEAKFGPDADASVDKPKHEHEHDFYREIERSNNIVSVDRIFLVFVDGANEKRGKSPTSDALKKDIEGLKGNQELVKKYTEIDSYLLAAARTANYNKFKELMGCRGQILDKLDDPSSEICKHLNNLSPHEDLSKETRPVSIQAAMFRYISFRYQKSLLEAAKPHNRSEIEFAKAVIAASKVFNIYAEIHVKNIIEHLNSKQTTNGARGPVYYYVKDSSIEQLVNRVLDRVQQTIVKHVLKSKDRANWFEIESFTHKEKSYIESVARSIAIDMQGNRLPTSGQKGFIDVVLPLSNTHEPTVKVELENGDIKSACVHTVGQFLHMAFSEVDCPLPKKNKKFSVKLHVKSNCIKAEEQSFCLDLRHDKRLYVLGQKGVKSTSGERFELHESWYEYVKKNIVEEIYDSLVVRPDYSWRTLLPEVKDKDSWTSIARCVTNAIKESKDKKIDRLRAFLATVMGKKNRPRIADIIKLNNLSYSVNEHKRIIQCAVSYHEESTLFRNRAKRALDSLDNNITHKNSFLSRLDKTLAGTDPSCDVDLEALLEKEFEPNWEPIKSDPSAIEQIMKDSVLLSHVIKWVRCDSSPCLTLDLFEEVELVCSTIDRIEQISNEDRTNYCKQIRSTVKVWHNRNKSTVNSNVSNFRSDLRKELERIFSELNMRDPSDDNNLSPSNSLIRALERVLRTIIAKYFDPRVKSQKSLRDEGGRLTDDQLRNVYHTYVEDLEIIWDALSAVEDDGFCSRALSNRKEEFDEELEEFFCNVTNEEQSSSAYNKELALNSSQCPNSGLSAKQLKEFETCLSKLLEGAIEQLEGHHRLHFLVSLKRALLAPRRRSDHEDPSWSERLGLQALVECLCEYHSVNSELLELLRTKVAPDQDS